ncbi:MAG: hypothetical protein AAGG01_09275 [Planctomycetota bacterium]
MASLLSPRILLVLAAASLTAGSLSAAAAHVDKHEEFGFSLNVPSSFEARPVPAETPGLLAFYAPKKAPLDRAAPVTHGVWRIDLEGADRASGPLVLQRWILETHRPMSLEPQRSVRKRFGRDPIRYEGHTLGEGGAERSLFVHAWLGDSDLIVFVGECEPDVLKRERRAFDRTAMSFRFFTKAAVEESMRKWARHYQRTSLPHRDERIKIAAASVDGWSVRDTEHSIILFHGPSDSPVLAQIARNLVALRRQFALDFPPDRPVDALSVVRVCRDRGEYLTYGGNPNTVGYFHPRVQELVLYDAREDRSEPMADDHPTMKTLYHEACHQFLHHTASSMSPHSWYDEGSAEFYAGAVLRSGVVKGIVGLDDREQYLRQPDVMRRLPSLESLMSMDQDAFYADADVHYSMGYALIRFLRTSKEASAERSWVSLPTRYFESLRSVWRKEAEGLVLSGLSGARYEAAVERARKNALAETLKGVDLPELENAFIGWLRAGASAQ